MVFHNDSSLFYEGMDTCSQNYGSTAFPTAQPQFGTLGKFANGFTGDVYVGVYMPIHLSIHVTCTAQSCDDYLQLADGSQFHWQPWMGNSFDRKPLQPRCFVFTPSPSTALYSVSPSSCYNYNTLVCMSRCPRRGTPIYPAPSNISAAAPQHPESVVNKIISRQKRLQQYNYDDVERDFFQTPETSINSQYMAELTDLHLLQTDPNFQVPRTPNPRHIVGYDCSNPLDVTPLRSDATIQSCNKTPRPKSQRNAEFLLLQSRDKVSIKVKNCVITETIIPHYCGMFSHSVFAPRWLQIEQDVSLSPEQCEQIWTNFKYVDPTGISHSIIPGDTKHVTYFAAGSTDDSTGSIKCQGSSFRYQGRTYEDMVVTVQQKVTILKQPAEILDNDLVHIPRLAIKLACSASTLKCVSPNFGTFIWSLPSNTCRYIKIRRTKGLIISDDSGQDTYMSNDGTLIRLALVNPTSKCGVVVYETNYARLFLTADLATDAFGDSTPHDLSIYTYANQQDGWLHGSLTSYIVEEFYKVHEYICRLLLSHGSSDYDRILAAQHGSIDGDTAFLGQGHFVTAAGEVYYRFRCSRIIVTARNSPSCYSSIPVTLSPADFNRYHLLHDLDSNNSTIEFFLEPHSRRLTVRGIKIKCPALFKPMYTGLNGNMIRLNPELSFVDPPAVLSPESFRELSLSQPDNPDFDQGGIYEPEIIRSHEKYTTSQRAVQDVSHTLASSAQDHDWFSNSATAQALLDPLTLSNKLSSAVQGLLPDFPTLGLLWDSLVSWGSFCSVIMGIVYFLTLIGGCCSCCVKKLPLYHLTNFFIYLKNGTINLIQQLLQALRPPPQTDPRYQSTNPPVPARNTLPRPVTSGQSSMRGEPQEPPADTQPSCPKPDKTTVEENIYDDPSTPGKGSPHTTMPRAMKKFPTHGRQGRSHLQLVYPEIPHKDNKDLYPGILLPHMDSLAPSVDSRGTTQDGEIAPTTREDLIQSIQVMLNELNWPQLSSSTTNATIHEDHDTLENTEMDKATVHRIRGQQPLRDSIRQELQTAHNKLKNTMEVSAGELHYTAQRLNTWRSSVADFASRRHTLYTRHPEDEREEGSAASEPKIARIN